MAFNSVEIIALLDSVLIIVKLLVISFSPRYWLKLTKGLYKSSVGLFVVELILAVIVFYFLLQSFTIVEIMAVITLGALLTGMTFALYAKEILGLASKILGKGMLKRMWLPILIWLALAVWTLVELF